MFKKNTAVTGFQIGHFIQTADGAAKTTGTPACKRLLDDTPGTLTNAASYDSTAGVWKIDLAAGDTNGDMVGLSFTLADCLPIGYTLRTTTKLVSDLNDAAGGDTAGVTTLLTRVVGTLATGTHNPQSGDAYARLTGTVEPAVADLPTNAELATALGTADDATLAAIAALNNLSSVQAQSAAAAALTAYDPPTNAELTARTLPTADYATATALIAVDAVTDKIDTALVLDGAVYQFTANALELAPTGGGSGLTAQETTNAVHNLAPVGVAAAGSIGQKLDDTLADTDELQTDWHDGGRLDLILDAAGSAGDPWITTLPGAYTGNQAGAILDAIRDVTAAIDVSAVTVTAANDAGVLTVIQSVTFGATVSGLTISATWAKLYWTLKESIYDDDDQAILQLVESNPGAGTDGLLYLDSAAIVLPITVADGTLTVNQAAGTVAIVVTDNATALLSAASELVWDIKTKDAAGATVQNTTGTASIVRAVTQTI